MSSSAASSDIVHEPRTGMTRDNLVSELCKKGPKIPWKTTAGPEEKARFLLLFPGIYTLEDIDTPIETVMAMTGGKWAFPDIPIPDGVIKRFPNDQKGFWGSVHTFYKECHELLGRPATYSDVFWIIFSMWTRELQEARNDLEWSKVCLTEKRSDPIFRMYVDIDLKEPAPMDKRTWGAFVAKVSTCVARAVAGCYPSMGKKDESLRMTVLVAKDFLKRADGGYKRGLHFVWPNLLVNHPTALSLVSHVELELTRKGPPRDMTQGQNSYEHAVDTSVYRTGLRLPCCPKSVRCKLCHKYKSTMINPNNDEDEAARRAQERVLCPEHSTFPQGFGFHIESSYHLTGIFNGDGSSVNAEVFGHLVSSAYKYKSTIKRGTVYDFTLRELASIRTTATEATPGFKGQAEMEKLLAQVRPDDERLQEYDEQKKRKRSRIANQRLITPLDPCPKDCHALGTTSPHLYLPSHTAVL